MDTNTGSEANANGGYFCPDCGEDLPGRYCGCLENPIIIEDDEDDDVPLLSRPVNQCLFCGNAHGQNPCPCFSIHLLERLAAARTEVRLLLRERRAEPVWGGVVMVLDDADEDEAIG